MPQITDIAISNLLLDQQNARLSEPQDGQDGTAIALARQQGSKLINLAIDIVGYGPDPISLVAVIATDDIAGKYTVLEGNRRVLTLKALRDPALISQALTSSQQVQFMDLAKRYSRNPVATVSCVVFENIEEAIHWVELRHTGENLGKGLVRWGGDEKDRFKSRRGTRTIERQIIDFVSKYGNLSPKARASRRGIITNVGRLMSTPQVRARLGVEIIAGQVYTRLPAEEVLKGLTKIVEDLKTGTISVADIYHAADRRQYVATFDSTELPRDTDISDEPLLLDAITQVAKPKPKQPSPKRRTSAQRQNVIPNACTLTIEPSRIDAIYKELRNLRVRNFPNAAAVLLRVFLELSVDDYLSDENLATEEELRGWILAKRMKTAAEDLKNKKRIPSALERAIRKVADSSRLLAPSTATFNQYVHNQYAIPSPIDLLSAWDELQPLFEAIWPSYNSE